MGVWPRVVCEIRNTEGGQREVHVALEVELVVRMVSEHVYHLRDEVGRPRDDERLQKGNRKL